MESGLGRWTKAGATLVDGRSDFPYSDLGDGARITYEVGG